MVPSMLELIFFYILQKTIQGYDSHFLYARERQYFLACASRILLAQVFYWRDFCLRKCASKIYDAIMQVLPLSMAAATAAEAATITARLTTTADANADANAPRQLQQQKQLPQQQQRNGKSWGGLPSQDVHGAGIGCIGGKQRPGNGGDNNCGCIVSAAGKCGGDLAGRRFLPPSPPSPPRNRLLWGGGTPGGPAAKRGAGPKHGDQG
jgi:hypothetical protein